MGLVLGLVLVMFLGAFVALGWVLGTRTARRSKAWPPDLPPPSVVYEQGFEAGYKEALEARDRLDVQTAPEASSGTSGPSAPWLPPAPPSSPDVCPHASGVGRPAGSGGARPGEAPGVPDGFGGATVGEAPVPPSPAERAATKAARDLRAINIALYSASLLFVAAGGLFIGAAVPGPARAATICAVVAIFYVGGLILHARLPRLRPAAVAFAGTGLALLPVAGLLFGVLTDEGPLAWFGTAVIGTIAYLLAAVRLQSRVVAYLSLPFFLSIALSSVSLIGGALVWYFTCSIGVAALLAVLAYPAPRWMPEVLTRAVLDAHRVLTPLALVASLLLGSILTPGERALLWVVGAVYFAAVLVFVPVRRVGTFYAMRLVATVATAFIVAALGLAFFWAVMALALCLALQVGVALVLAAPLRRLLTSDTRPPTALPPTVLPPTVLPPTARPSAALPPAVRRSGGEVRYRRDVLVTFALTALVAAVVAVPPRGSGVDAPDVLVPVLLVLSLGMWISVRLGGATEVLVLPGILLAAISPGDHPWRAEVVLALSVGYFLVRAQASAGGLRERFLLAARAGGVVLLPVAVLVHLRALELPGGDAGEIALLAVVLGAVVNQAAEVVRTRGAGGTPYSPSVICASSGASLLAALVLAADAGAGSVAAVAIWITVLAGTTTTLALPLADEGHAMDRPSTGGTAGTPERPGGGAKDDDASRPSDHAGRTAARQGGRPALPSVLQTWYVEGIGPVSLLAAALSCAAAGFGYRSYEALLGAVVLYAGLNARRAIDHRRRGVYLLAAQIAFTALTAVISGDLDLTVHGLLAVVALGIALQEIVRVILRRRLRNLGLQSSSAWLSTAVLAVLPLVYAVLAGPAVQLGVIVVHLALLLVVSATLFVVQREEAAAYPALYALAASIAVLAGVLDTVPQGWLVRAPLPMWGGALAAAACLLALVVVRRRAGDERQRLPVLVGAGLFTLEATLLSFTDGGWDRVPVTLVVAGALFALSRREVIPWLDAAAALAVIVLSTVLVEEVTQEVPGLPGSAVMQVLLGAVLAAGLLYLARDLLPSDNHDELRHRILGTTALSWTAVAAVAAMIPSQEAVAGSVVLGAVALLAVREVPADLRPVTGELAFLVLVAGTQRITWVVSDGLVLFWAVQWWVVALALLAVSSFLRGSARRGPVWLSASGILLSGSGLLTIAGGTTGAQIWSLCGHVLLLAAGVALSRRLFSLWGAVGIALALLWFLRGYTFLLLTVAALALLAFAVWKLNRQTRGSDEPAPVTPGPPAGPEPSSAERSPARASSSGGRAAAESDVDTRRDTGTGSP